MAHKRSKKVRIPLDIYKSIWSVGASWGSPTKSIEETWKEYKDYIGLKKKDSFIEHYV